MNASTNPNDYFAVAIGFAMRLLIEGGFKEGEVSKADICRASNLHYEREGDSIVAVEMLSPGHPEIARLPFPSIEAEIALVELDSDDPFKILIMILLATMARAVTGRHEMRVRLRRPDPLPDIEFMVYVEHGCTRITTNLSVEYVH